MSDDSKKLITRRNFLTTTAAASAGFLALQACGGAAPAPAESGGAAAEEKPAEAAAPAEAADPTQVKLVGWDYAPQLVRENLDIFEEQNPDIKVEFEATSGDYLQHLLSMFSAGTTLDTMYVRDQYYAGWFDAEFINPIDGLPGLADLDADTFQLNLDSMSFKGKRLGTCYYTDFMVWQYNQELLDKAGVELPFDLTLDELRAACEAIKSEGIMEFPLEMAWQKQSNAFWTWWAMVYSSGGTNITDEGEVKVDEDQVSLELLKWWVAAANDWQITDPKSNMEAAGTGELTGYWAEQTAFLMNSKYDLERANAPDRSKVAREGTINGKFTLIPAFNKSDPHTSIHWTRMYSLATNSEHPEETWRLIYYLGGKDAEGEFFGAKRWFLLRGLGFPFKPLWEDQEVLDKLATFADPELVKQAAPNARPREGINFGWYSEWDLHHQSMLQEAVLQKITPEEALKESGDKARDVKAKWEI
jgi:multiple sugar transport system substrate-binding protein